MGVLTKEKRTNFRPFFNVVKVFEKLYLNSVFTAYGISEDAEPRCCEGEEGEQYTDYDKKGDGIV